MRCSKENGTESCGCFIRVGPQPTATGTRRILENHQPARALPAYEQPGLRLGTVNYLSSSISDTESKSSSSHTHRCRVYREQTLSYSRPKSE